MHVTVPARRRLPVAVALLLAASANLSATAPVPAEIGTRYCTPAVPNSTGWSGEILVEGSTKVADDQVLLRAQQLPPTTIGMFLMSEHQAHVPQPPGSYGVLCLGGPILRLPVWVTDGAGKIDLPVSLTDLPGGQTVDPGETWNFQAWYRDNAFQLSNFTDAVSVAFE